MTGIEPAGIDRSAADVLATLRRWEQAGGTWQLRFSGPAKAVIALCTCTGGEEVDRICTDDPAVLARLAERADPGRPLRP